MNKKYYFPNEDIEEFFGSEYPVCISMKFIKKLAFWREVSIYSIRNKMHIASKQEIAEYGIYDE